MNFIDTCVLYGSLIEKDKYHKKSKKIIGELIKQKEKIVYSDYVLDELLTLIKSREEKNTVNKILEILFNSEIEMLKIEERHISMAIELFKKYEKLSFTDCTNIALMLDYEIKTIYSFDKEFDKISKIIRKEVY